MIAPLAWPADAHVMALVAVLGIAETGCGGAPRGVAAAGEASDASTSDHHASGASSSETDASTTGADGESTAASPCVVTHEGNLFIGDGLDLSSFANIREVTGNLVIARSDPPLLDLAPLGCLERVGGSLQIAQTAGLVDLTGLQRLSFIGDRMLVSDNADLRSLEGLDALRYVSGITIAGNPALEQLGLRALQAAGTLSVGEACFDGYVRGNPALTTIDGLDSLLSLGGLGIHANASLVSLAGLYDLAEREVHVGSLHVDYNDSLAPEAIEAASEALGLDAAACGNLGEDRDACRCPIG